MTDAKQANLTEIPKDYHLHERLGFRLSRLSRMMQDRLVQSLAQHGITRLKWCVLSGIELEGLHAPSELANHIGITRPAISRLLKTMIKDGLVKRSLVAEDGRSRQISITDLGREKLAVCWPLVENNQEHFLGKLTSQQRSEMDTILRQMMSGETATFDDF